MGNSGITVQSNLGTTISPAINVDESDHLLITWQLALTGVPNSMDIYAQKINEAGEIHWEQMTINLPNLREKYSGFKNHKRSKKAELLFHGVIIVMIFPTLMYMFKGLIRMEHHCGQQMEFPFV